MLCLRCLHKPTLSLPAGTGTEVYRSSLHKPTSDYALYEPQGDSDMALWESLMVLVHPIDAIERAEEHRAKVRRTGD